MSSRRYFVLWRKNRRFVAAEVPGSDNVPESISIQGATFCLLRKEDPFFFWDEFRDAAGATIGYAFMLPESPTFRKSSFVCDSENVTVDREYVEVQLAACPNPTIEGVQGFDSEVYVNEADPSDCAVYMLDWSENIVAFPLQSLG